MPKMKTKKALKLRFKKTGTGKLRQNHPGRRHILTKKTAKRKRQLRRPSLLSDAIARTYKRLMSAG